MVNVLSEVKHREGLLLKDFPGEDNLVIEDLEMRRVKVEVKIVSNGSLVPGVHIVELLLELVNAS